MKIEIDENEYKYLQQCQKDLVERQIYEQKETIACCEPTIDTYSYNLVKEENERLKQALINIALKL